MSIFSSGSKLIVSGLIICILLTLSCIAQAQDLIDSIAPDSNTVEAHIMSTDHWTGSDVPLSVRSRQTHFPGGWFFLLNALLLIMLALKYLIFPGYTKRAWNALLNENLFFQWIREKSPVKPLLILLEAILKYYAIAAIICMALAFLVEGYFLNPADLFRIMGVVGGFFLLKTAVAYIIARLTDCDELFRTLQINSTIFNSNLSFVFVPAIFIVAYLSSSLHIFGVYLLIAMIFLAVIMLSVKSMRIIYKSRMAFNLHFFLYLCAFEILPYLIIVRLFEHEVL